MSNEERLAKIVSSHTRRAIHTTPHMHNPGEQQKKSHLMPSGKQAYTSNNNKRRNITSIHQQNGKRAIVRHVTAAQLIWFVVCTLEHRKQYRTEMLESCTQRSFPACEKAVVKWLNVYSIRKWGLIERLPLSLCLLLFAKLPIAKDKCYISNLEITAINLTLVLCCVMMVLLRCFNRPRMDVVDIHEEI